MHNQTIFEVSQAEVSRKRRRPVVMVFFMLVCIAGFSYIAVTDSHERSLSYRAGEIVIPILVAILVFIFLSLGLKQNGFAVTTTGIYPPSKPNRRLFSGRYFIPYSDVESMDLVYLPYHDSERKVQDTHPHAAIMHLRGEKTVYVNVVGGWAPMYFYVKSEATMRGIYRMLEVIKREIDEQRAAGVKDIVIPAEKLRAAMKQKKGEHHVD